MWERKCLEFKLRCPYRFSPNQVLVVMDCCAVTTATRAEAKTKRSVFFIMLLPCLGIVLQDTQGPIVFYYCFSSGFERAIRHGRPAFPKPNNHTCV